MHIRIWCFVLLAVMMAVSCFGAESVVSDTAGIPEVKVPNVKQVLAIDGKIEACWGDAAKLPLVANHGPGAGSKVTILSEARVMRDAKNLYVSFIFEDSNITFKYVNADDILWDSGDKLDLAEMLLQPDGANLVYYEFAVNPVGAMLDAQVKWKNGKPTWNILWPKKQPKVSAGRLKNSENGVEGWCVELAIPFESIGFTPGKGSSLKANFHRADYDLAAKWLSWSPTFDRSIHVPVRFGKLIF